MGCRKAEGGEDLTTWRGAQEVGCGRRKRGTLALEDGAQEGRWRGDFTVEEWVGRGGVGKGYKDHDGGQQRGGGWWGELSRRGVRRGGRTRAMAEGNGELGGVDGIQAE